MNLPDYFDQYSLSARVRPALFIVLPIILTAYILFEPLRTLLGSLLGILLTCGVVNFFANQMSSQGNVLQDKLFKKWGGAPTTLILRHSDNELDKYTKQRYREKLVLLVSNFKNVSERAERANPTDADQYYISAINYLREKTRDSEKYPLILKENMNYGFSRNLLAFKSTAITIILISLAISLLIIVVTFKDKYVDINSLSLLSPQYYVLVILHIIFLLFWCLMINETWVKVRAYAYAKRLLSSCEDIT
ncbi:hypothetical protein [Acinetobacter lwoffii]|uniref:hypothetical protein n=1 Tax=Acinetobacter lwoffii TaxID=28090 RepID=UPI0021CD5A51|nr:hypothetical protein [Acinetobacter lwoffii]MCU4422381.1 hypothetical protein [Acinetobacter lwoffii]MCU4449426.1 hypothetical protein [Acinetobacter lwoffii]